MTSSEKRNRYRELDRNIGRLTPDEFDEMKSLSEDLSREAEIRFFGKLFLWCVIPAALFGGCIYGDAAMRANAFNSATGAKITPGQAMFMKLQVIQPAKEQGGVK